MSVGMVTARSHQGLPLNIGARPSSASVTKLRVSTKASRMRKAARRQKARWSKSTTRSIGRVKSAERGARIVRTRIPAAVSTRGIQTLAQRAALKDIAKLVVGAALRSNIATLATLQTLGFLYSITVQPDNFPGFDAINPGWRWPSVAGPPFFDPIGSYAPNFLDVGPWRDDPAPRSLLDTNDVGPPPFGLGIRYWGDFGTNPYPDEVPGVNWPRKARYMPETLPAPVPAIAPALQPANRFSRKYRKTEDLSRKTRPRPRWRPNRNMRITINLRPTRGARPGTTVRTRSDVARIRGDDDGKAKPANQFVYAVLKELANAMGETKEWIDILAEASGYDRRTRVVPSGIDKGHETAAKAYWLFVGQGVNNIDWGELQRLVRENAVEDFLIGIAGRMSKSAARSLGLTVGPMTGLAL